MSLTAAAFSIGSTDFTGNIAGRIQAWVETEIESQTSTQTTIRYNFGFNQTVYYSDNQDFDAWIDGSSVYSSTFANNKSADNWQFYTTTRTYTRPAYGSATDYHDARCQVGGIYDGPTSNTGTHNITTGVPAKAGTVLDSPSNFYHTAASSSSISYTWDAPVSSGVGPAASSYILQLATSSTFSTLIYNANIGNVLSKAVGGLTRATTYYARVLAVNSIGNGSWSGINAASTLATVPDAPATPTITAPTSSGFTVNFVAPANGGSAITSYTIQVSKDNFASVSNTFAGVTSSPKVLTGLLPGVTYKARVAAVNAIGTGSYSPSSGTIQSLGGVKIWTGSTWGEGIVRCWNGSAWVVVIVRKWNGTSWVV